MAVDPSAVARVLGIETQFQARQDGTALSLPQRLAVFAQGTTLAVYALTKFVATSAYQVAAKLGFGSPAHLIALQLWPNDGKGVGNIPVTFYPLDDHASGVAAAGAITPTGSQTTAAAYYVRIAGMLSEKFVIPVSSTVTAVCVLIWDAITAVLDLPMIPTFTYGTVTASHTTIVSSSNGTLTVLSASGSPRPGTWLLTCTSAVANGGVWSLTDPLGTVVDAAVTMTPGPLAETVIVSNGLTFTLTDGSNDFAVGDVFTITVPATAVVLTAKAKGEWTNDLVIEVLGDDYGTTFTITAPTGGAANPTLDSAIAQIGEVWESMGINALNIEDTTALDALSTFGETRWGELVHKPFVCFTGNTIADVDDATAICSARRTDRTNGQLVAPGSVNLPCVVAARQVARIVTVANAKPASGYATQAATGLIPGTDAEQWNSAQRELAVKAGSSTVQVKDGVVEVSDVCTFYRPTGDQTPAYRKVVSIVKLQQLCFNMAVIFEAAEWASAPLIPDDDATVNPDARKPKHAKSKVNAMLASLGTQAILSNVEAAKALTTAGISGVNGDRLDVGVSVQLSGNTDVISVVQKFGFYYGTAAVVG